MDSKGRDVMLDETEVKGAGSLKEGREGRKEGSEAGEDLLTYRTNKCLVGLGEALGTPSYILELGQLEFLLSAIKVVRWSTRWTGLLRGVKRGMVEVVSICAAK